MGAGVVQKTGDGGRRRRGRGRSRPMAEINVTPFVDVMLVLLIIFMVAAPLMTVGVPVELPKTAASALPTEQEEPLTVTITPRLTTMLLMTAATWMQAIEMKKFQIVMHSTLIVTTMLRARDRKHGAKMTTATDRVLNNPSLLH